MNPQNPQPASTNPPKPGDTPFQANIVSNIPIHTAGGPSAMPAAPTNDDTDKIMQDVGNQLKKEDVTKPKHHFFSKPKPSAPLIAQPLAPAQPPPPPQAPGLPAAGHQPVAKPQPQPAKSKSSVPIFTILVAIIITSGLMALAVLTL